jgi:hypothetical protein
MRLEKKVERAASARLWQGEESSAEVAKEKSERLGDEWEADEQQSIEVGSMSEESAPSRGISSLPTTAMN